MYCANSLSRLRLHVACLYLFALQNIALGRYLDTRRNILEHLRNNDVRPDIYIYKISAIEHTRKLASLAIIIN